MKNSRAVVVMYCLVALLACQDSKDELKSSRDELSYYKAVGMEIPFATGMEWIDFYKKHKSEKGRLGLALASHTMSMEQTEDLLASVTDPVGIAFHYATDGLGVRHIIAVPIDASLSVWSSIPGRIYVDTNTGNPISQSTAEAWAQTYKDAHDGDIWFHFFGIDTINEIFDVPYFTTIDIQPGINILNLTPQLLLVVWNEGTITGRTASDQDGKMFDASNPCPPCGIQ